LVAKKGAGCFARKLEEDAFRRLEMPQPTSLSDELSVVISAHETFEDLPLGKSGVRPTRVSRLCCGSLAKYVKVALGEAHVFIQHPKANGDAFVNSWDHGAGVLICEETGARVTDALGEALRFEESEDKRRFAPGGGGVICAARSIHDDVVRAYARGLEVR
jgi:3'-phosphoadenosine 5'-phosphosulfate (PAPS) 3'-phosphatase